jgi:hypothetical protein
MNQGLVKGYENKKFYIQNVSYATSSLACFFMGDHLVSPCDNNLVLVNENVCRNSEGFCVLQLLEWRLEVSR